MVIFMDALEQIRQRYARYQEEIRAVRAKTSPLAGFMGLGHGPDKHPCNMEFYEDVGKLVEAFAKTGPDAAQMLEVVKWMLEAPVGNENTDWYWYMYASQGHCKELIPMLAPADCAQLRDWFDEQFPKKNRLPVQDQIYKLLKKQAKKK